MGRDEGHVVCSWFSSLPALPGWTMPVAAIALASMVAWGCTGGRVSFGDELDQATPQNGGAGGGGTSAEPADRELGSGDDPLDVHPWPMAHRSAENVPVGAFDTGTEVPFVRWAVSVARSEDAEPQIRPLVAGDGRVFVATKREVVVVDAAGQVIARIPSSHPRGIALTKNGDVIVNDDAGVARFAVSAPTTPLWRNPPRRGIGAWIASSPLVAPGGDVFVVDAGQDLLRVSSKAAGAVAWRVSLPAPTPTPALASMGYVYLVVTGETGGPRAYDVAGGPLYIGKGAGFLAPPVIDRQTSSVVFTRVGSGLRRTKLGARYGGPGDPFGPGDLRTNGSLPVRTRIGGAGPVAGDAFSSFVTLSEPSSTFPRDFVAIASFRADPPVAERVAVWAGVEDPFLWQTEPFLASPAATDGGTLVVGSPGGGLDFFASRGLPIPQFGQLFSGFRVDHETGVAAKPPSPSLGTNGDVYFTAAEGLLYRLGTTGNPCAEPAEPTTRWTGPISSERVDVAIGETVTVSRDLGGSAANAAYAAVQVDGKAVAPLPGSYPDELRFEMPEIPLPPGGRAVTMSVTTDGGSFTFCRRVIPRRPTRGARLTITRVSSPGDGPTDVAVVAKGLVVEGGGFLEGRWPPPERAAHWPELFVVSVCLGEGRRWPGATPFPPLSDRCFALQTRTYEEERMVLDVPRLIEPEVAAAIAPNGEEVPLVVRVEAPFSGYPAAAFAFRARLTK